jgi:hypothetical protein
MQKYIKLISNENINNHIIYRTLIEHHKPRVPDKL